MADKVDNFSPLKRGEKEWYLLPPPMRKDSVLFKPEEVKWICNKEGASEALR
jgi:hypothetical protein